MAALMDACINSGDMRRADRLWKGLRTRGTFEMTTSLYRIVTRLSAWKADGYEARRLLSEFYHQQFNPVLLNMLDMNLPHERGEARAIRSIYHNVMQACAKDLDNFQYTEEIFENLKATNLPPNNVTFSILINAHATNGDVARAKKTWKDFRKDYPEILPNIYNFTSLLNSYKVRSHQARQRKVKKRIESIPIEDRPTNIDEAAIYVRALTFMPEDTLFNPKWRKLVREVIEETLISEQEERYAMREKLEKLYWEKQDRAFLLATRKAVENAPAPSTSVAALEAEKIEEVDDNEFDDDGQGMKRFSHLKNFVQDGHQAMNYVNEEDHREDFEPHPIAVVGKYSQKQTETAVSSIFPSDNILGGLKSDDNFKKQQDNLIERWEPDWSSDEALKKSFLDLRKMLDPSGSNSDDQSMEKDMNDPISIFNRDQEKQRAEQIDPSFQPIEFDTSVDLFEGVDIGRFNLDKAKEVELDNDNLPVYKELVGDNDITDAELETVIQNFVRMGFLEEDIRNLIEDTTEQEEQKKMAKSLRNELEADPLTENWLKLKDHTLSRNRAPKLPDQHGLFVPVEKALEETNPDNLLEEAMFIFNEITNPCGIAMEPNTETVNTLLKTFANSLALTRSRKIFDVFYDRFGLKRNKYTYSLMVEMYAKSQRLEKCLEIYEMGVKELGIKKVHPDMVGFMMDAFARKNRFDEAFGLLQIMKDEEWRIEERFLRILRIRCIVHKVEPPALGFIPENVHLWNSKSTIKRHQKYQRYTKKGRVGSQRLRGALLRPHFQ